MKSQKRVHGFKIALLIFLIILLLLALLIAVGYGYYRSKVEMLQPDQVIAPEDMILSQDEMDELVEDSHELADQMNERDLLLLGLTGGCSALMTYPPEGISLENTSITFFYFNTNLLKLQ